MEQAVSQERSTEPEVAAPASKRSRRIWRRVAQLGFLFFLLKGITWLVVAGLAWRLA
jgi:hypothetical protein